MDANPFIVCSAWIAGYFLLVAEIHETGVFHGQIYNTQTWFAKVFHARWSLPVFVTRSTLKLFFILILKLL